MNTPTHLHPTMNNEHAPGTAEELEKDVAVLLSKHTAKEVLDYFDRYRAPTLPAVEAAALSFASDGTPSVTQRMADNNNFAGWWDSRVNKSATPEPRYIWNAACAYARREAHAIITRHLAPGLQGGVERVEAWWLCKKDGQLSRRRFPGSISLITEPEEPVLVVWTDAHPPATPPQNEAGKAIADIADMRENGEPPCEILLYRDGSLCCPNDESVSMRLERLAAKLKEVRPTLEFPLWVNVVPQQHLAGLWALWRDYKSGRLTFAQPATPTLRDTVERAPSIRVLLGEATRAGIAAGEIYNDGTASSFNAAFLDRLCTALAGFGATGEATRDRERLDALEKLPVIICAESPGWSSGHNSNFQTYASKVPTIREAADAAIAALSRPSNAGEMAP